MAGDPKYETSQDLPDFPFARYAELLGLRGIRVDKPQDIGPAWDEALAADRPVVYEAYTDPDVPTLPPHIPFKMAAAYSSALLRAIPKREGLSSRRSRTRRQPFCRTKRRSKRVQ